MKKICDELKLIKRDIKELQDAYKKQTTTWFKFGRFPSDNEILYNTSEFINKHPLKIMFAMLGGFIALIVYIDRR